MTRHSYMSSCSGRVVFLFLGLFLSFSESVLAQPQSALQRQLESINIERIMTNVRDISSPAFEGREIGTMGNMKAKEWLESYFVKFELEPLGTSYDQSFSMARYTLAGKNEVRTKSDTLSVIPSPFTPSIDEEGIVSTAIPKNNIVVLNLPSLTSMFADTVQQLAQNYAKIGAKALLIKAHLDTLYHYDDYVHLPKLGKKDRYNTSRPYLQPDTLALPVAFISPDVSLNDGDRIHLSITVNAQTRTISNVMGLKQGSLSPKNMIIFSVPFDGEGLHPNDGTPFGGASSTGAGLSVMLEWMALLSELDIQPETSILFAGVNAASRGNSGRFALLNHPLLKEFNIIGMIELGSLGYSLTGTAPHSLYLQQAALTSIVSNKVKRLPLHEHLTIHSSDIESPLSHSKTSIPYLRISGDKSPFDGRVLDAYNHIDYGYLFSNTQYIISLAWTLSSFN